MSRARVARAGEFEFVLERMTEHDLLYVVNIEETCGLSIWGWDGYHAELDRPESVMLVARFHGKNLHVGSHVIGFIAARVAADELHINNIGVVEGARRSGVGGMLLDEALRRGALLGARRAVLEVRASNRAALALYERHGFETSGRRRGYYKNPTEDALVMTADIGAEA